MQVHQNAIWAKNGPATFQRAIDVILASVHWQFALVHLNSSFIFPEDAVDHIEPTRRALRVLYQASDKPKLRKCKIRVRTIDYYCHLIRPGHLELARHATKAVAKL